MIAQFLAHQLARTIMGKVGPLTDISFVIEVVIDSSSEQNCDKNNSKYQSHKPYVFPGPPIVVNLFETMERCIVC